MRSLLLLAVLGTGCTSTSTLTNFSTAGRVGGHRRPFVANGEHIEPGTVLQFRDRNGRWSPRVDAGDLRVNDEGAWLDGHVSIGQLARSIRMFAFDPDLPRIVEDTRREVADARHLEVADGVLTLTADPDDLTSWVQDIEMEVAAGLSDDAPSVDDCELSCDPKLNALRRDGVQPLGTWDLELRAGGRFVVSGMKLANLLEHGASTRLGWRWSDIDQIEAENLDGGKTFGILMASVMAAPIAILGAGFAGLLAGGTRGAVTAPGKLAKGLQYRSRASSSGFSLRISTRRTPEPTWQPEIADEGRTASALFTPAARRRSVIELVTGLDGAGASSHERAGLFVDVRLQNVLELGGGFRVMHAESSWNKVPYGHMGLHLPLGTEHDAALALGLELGKGDAVAHAFRVPFGLRYTPTGRVFVFAQPFVPTHTRMTSERAGRWGFDISGGFGVTL